MFKKFWRDLVIVLSAVWINLLLFVLLLMAGAILLKCFRVVHQTGWPQSILDAFHMAVIERVDTGGELLPILLSFILPLGTAIILGEGVLRFFSIYMQRRVNRREWDLMVLKTFTNHTIVCGVGEMGRQLASRMLAEQPLTPMVLIDPRPGLLAELGLIGEQVIHYQADMADIETLEKAGIRKAARVILTAGEDALNLEVAYKIQKLNPRVPVWVRLHNSGLAELLDLSRQPHIHFFCPYQQAAEAILAHIMG